MIRGKPEVGLDFGPVHYVIDAESEKDSHAVNLKVWKLCKHVYIKVR